MEQQEIWEGKADETVEQSEEDVSILGLEDDVSWKPADDSQVYMFIVFLAGWWVILLDFIFESNNRKLHCY